MAGGGAWKKTTATWTPTSSDGRATAWSTGSPTTSTVAPATPGAVADRARGCRRAPARDHARTRRGPRPGLAGFSRHRAARRHPLEPPRLHGLLRHHRLRARESSASSCRRRSTSTACCGAPARRPPSSSCAVLQWLRAGLGLPDDFFGFLTDTASVSSLLALAAARERAGLDIRQRGMAGRPDLPRLRVYASDQAHSSIAKACLTLGLGLDGFRPIPHDAAYRMDVGALRRGHRGGPRRRHPAAGRGRHRRHHLHHVGGPGARDRRGLRHGGSVAPRRRGLRRLRRALSPSTAGAGRLRAADSLVFNPHKWLFTPIDCSALYTRHPDTFRRAFSLVPEYLDDPRELRDRWWTSWTTASSSAAGSAPSSCGGCCAPSASRGSRTGSATTSGWPSELRRLDRRQPGFERMAPAPFSVVCFRARPDGARPARTSTASTSGCSSGSTPRARSSSPTPAWMTASPCGSPIGNLGTTAADVERCQDLLFEGLNVKR